MEHGKEPDFTMEKYTKMAAFQIKHIPNENELLNLIQVSSEEMTCEIYPNLGASLQKLAWKGNDIIKGIENDQEGIKAYHQLYTSAALFPFPGRIENGTYFYQEKAYALELNEPQRPNAIHGLVAFETFELVHTIQEGNSIKLEFLLSKKNASTGFPFDFDLTIQYQISNSNVDVSFQVENTGDTSFPFGIGWHPYFQTSDLSETRLSFDAKNEVVCNSNMIPIDQQPYTQSSSFKIGSKELDTCFVLEKPQLTLTTNTYQLNIQMGASNPAFVQLYIPNERDCIAIEPMTCIPNAFNHKKGLLKLAPNSSYTYTINLSFHCYE